MCYALRCMPCTCSVMLRAMSFMGIRGCGTRRAVAAQFDLLFFGALVAKRARSVPCVCGVCPLVRALSVPFSIASHAYPFAPCRGRLPEHRHTSELKRNVTRTPLGKRHKTIVKERHRRGRR